MRHLEFQKITLQEPFVFLFHKPVFEVLLELKQVLYVLRSALRHPFAFLAVEQLQIIACVDAEGRLIGGLATAETPGCIHELVANVDGSLDLTVLVLLSDVL